MKRIISIVISIIMAFTVVTCLDLTDSYASTVISRTGADGITLDNNGDVPVSIENATIALSQDVSEYDGTEKKAFCNCQAGIDCSDKWY